MAEYTKEEIKNIEEKWRKEWERRGVYKVVNDTAKPKYYVLDMFPYPSGAGLHVGHPLGYIASDIVARFKRLQGFNVLHPMGFDAFGLPAEQYALEHGIHPAISTADNINNFKKQLGNIGFSYDWSREVQTCDPKYYRWTQWIFLQIFDSWFNRKKEKAERISELIKNFEAEGNVNHTVPNAKSHIQNFSSIAWKNYSEKEKHEILMDYRLAYLAYTDVNWCEALGTVLANDEVINGVSYRGGFPVVKKQMRQWSLRITEYAERLLKGLDEIAFSESMKEIQRNWIGKSVGARMEFDLTPRPPLQKRGGDLTPDPSPQERGSTSDEIYAQDFIFTSGAKTWNSLKENVRENRKNPTEAEDIFWQAVRNSQLGFRFRRQHTIGKFIVDFVCLEKKLVVEIDGGIHDSQKREDEERTKILEHEGFIVVRFTNDDVLNKLSVVLQNIKAELSLQNFSNSEGITSPSLLERGPGGEVLQKSKPDTSHQSNTNNEGGSSPTPLERGPGGEVLQKNKSEISNQTKTKSEGDSSPSPLERGPGGEVLTVFTTRPDTIFGVDFMVLAPEHELVKKITTDEQKEEVEKYLKYVESRSEIDRMAEVKKITGAFTGAYAINPFNEEQIPIWISEYVLAGYGTGAIMGVPCGDERDHKFAKHFQIPITNIIGSYYNGEEANPTKDAILENSDFLNGMVMHEAIDVVVDKLEEMGIGKRQVNYKMRDAGWSRQRYWGEPFPVVYKDDVPYAMKESELPLELPESDNFKPSGNGEGPLANLNEWINFPARSAGGSPNAKRDSNTMPTHAGAAWYFLRYMDPHNENAFADEKALDYWNQVDVYIGGSEHAVAHLLYARLWTKVLHDLGYLKFDEPFKKLINQGKITGNTEMTHRILKYWGWDENLHQITFDFLEDENSEELTTFKLNEDIDEFFISDDFKDRLKKKGWKMEPGRALHDLSTGEWTKVYMYSSGYRLPIELVTNSILDTHRFATQRSESKKAFICRNGIILPSGNEIKFNDGKIEFVTYQMVEKMSKSYYNVVNPDSVIEDYGADTLRMYEMFLGPLEQSKPWSTSGIDGVFKFLRRFWNLMHDAQGNFKVSDAAPTREELKVLHKTIKKVGHDIENFSFNTSVSEFMICANELSSLKCNKRAVLEPLVIALSPFAPHISEELWSLLGHTETILNAKFPQYDDQYLIESTFSYPISINGKVRAQMEFALDMPQEDIEKIVVASEIVQKWTAGKPPKKVIIVQGKIVNVVL